MCGKATIDEAAEEEFLGLFGHATACRSTCKDITSERRIGPSSTRYARDIYKRVEKKALFVENALM